jgi:hypothetical protein
MAHHKRKRPQARRSGCLLCKHMPGSISRHVRAATATATGLVERPARRARPKTVAKTPRQISRLARPSSARAGRALVKVMPHPPENRPYPGAERRRARRIWGSRSRRDRATNLRRAVPAREPESRRQRQPDSGSCGCPPHPWWVYRPLTVCLYDGSMPVGRGERIGGVFLGESDQGRGVVVKPRAERVQHAAGSPDRRIVCPSSAGGRGDGTKLTFRR